MDTMARGLQRVLGLAAALLFVTVTATEARDLCINPNTRLSRFKQPGRGQCLPVAGTSFHKEPSVVGHYDRVSDTVCTRSDGTKLYLALTITNGLEAEVVHQTIDIQLLSLAYVGIGITIFGNTTPIQNANWGGQAAYCSQVRIP
jgi:hypothetical protein